MTYNKQNNKNQTKNKPDNNSKSVIVDFGIRAIVNQNKSKLVALPKTALTNCGEFTQVRVQLVQESGTKHIKLVPITGGGETK